MQDLIFGKIMHGFSCEITLDDNYDMVLVTALS